MSPNRFRVTLPEFAEMLGVHRSYAWKLAADGVIAKPIDGTVALGPALRRYLKHLANPVAETSPRSELLEEQTRKLRLENDTREAEICDTDSVIALADAMIDAVESEVADFPKRATKDRELRVRLEREIGASVARIKGAMAAMLNEALVAGETDELFSGGENDAVYVDGAV